MAGATSADLPSQTSLLLVANHVSWWDGFLLRAVQKRLRPEAALLTVMLESELRRAPFFRWLGAVGLDPTSVSSTRALLRTLGEWRARCDTGLAVSYFPQGRIWPSSCRPLGFRRGVSAVAARMTPVSIVPVALHIEPLTSPTPHAFALIGEPLVLHEGKPDLRAIERQVTSLLDELHGFLQRAGEDAARRWPTAVFERTGRS